MAGESAIAAIIRAFQPIQESVRDAAFPWEPRPVAVPSGEAADRVASAGSSRHRIYAEFVHFVDGRLITHDREVLDRLLQYGPTAATSSDQQNPPSWSFLAPAPSPWSSEATDIARSCGTTRPPRGRGVAYYLN